jgi:hypothetical protein
MRSVTKSTVLRTAVVAVTASGALWCSAQVALAEEKKAAAGKLVGGHPDLQGDWVGLTGSMSPPTSASKGNDGSVTVNLNFGALAKLGVPPKNVPAYKPELVAKTQELFKKGAKEDNIVKCGQPGLPRVGAPQKIIQSPTELVFLYADSSGMAWRVIPTDGRKHRDYVDPTYYGDSVGRWEGDTLVIDTRNFSEDIWFGEFGYFHSDQMRVTERIRMDGDSLVWQATVEDPGVLLQPWVKEPVVMQRAMQPIEEPPVCVPTEYVDEAGHHVQRF